MSRITLNVPDISCGHCKTSIEGAVNELAGVESALVDIEARSVAVAFDETHQTRERIVEAIEGQGYEVAGDQ